MRTTTSATSIGTKEKTRVAAPAPGLQNTKYKHKFQTKKHKQRTKILTVSTSTGTKAKTRGAAPAPGLFVIQNMKTQNTKYRH